MDQRRPDDRRPAAVVVGLDCITGLQTARLLAGRGIPVIGIAANPRHFCARTRVPKRVIAAPTSGPGLVAALTALASDLPPPGSAFLVPCSDAAVLTMSEARADLPPAYRFVLPDHELLARLVDKVAFAELAAEHDLPIPPTAVIRDLHDAHRAAATLGFPIVVKPPIKTAGWQASAGAKAIRVEDPAALLALVEQALGWSDVLIAQTWIDGGEDRLISCNAYFDREGRPQATFMARKLRQWPLDTGTSSLGEEIRDDEALEASVRLFSTVGYRGLAYLEVKRDAQTGALGIIEPNLGRPTGRSAIAERGGVELLLTAYADALGLPLPVNRTQAYRGAKWIYWRHDLQASVVRIRRGELTVPGWIRSVGGRPIEAVGSVRDPLPFLLDIAGTVRALLGAASRRLGRPRGSLPATAGR
ncbi:MAG: carboxylate--amine ligase [Chloroflexota bacterium]